jgi:hypothetical protein
MAHCHMCGKDVSIASGIQRHVRTGTKGDGSAFFRTVLYCRPCADKQEDDEASRLRRHRHLLLAGALLVVGAVVYGILVYLGKLSPPG